MMEGMNDGSQSLSGRMGWESSVVKWEINNSFFQWRSYIGEQSKSAPEQQTTFSICGCVHSTKEDCAVAASSSKYFALPASIISVRLGVLCQPVLCRSVHFACQRYWCSCKLCVICTLLAFECWVPVILTSFSSLLHRSWKGWKRMDPSKHKMCFSLAQVIGLCPWINGLHSVASVTHSKPDWMIMLVCCSPA